LKNYLKLSTSFAPRLYPQRNPLHYFSCYSIVILSNAKDLAQGSVMRGKGDPSLTLRMTAFFLLGLVLLLSKILIPARGLMSREN